MPCGIVIKPGGPFRFRSLKLVVNGTPDLPRRHVVSAQECRAVKVIGLDSNCGSP